MAGVVDQGDHGEHGAYSEVFEDGEVARPQTVHRIRANSTIMQMKKLLVANRGEIREISLPRDFQRCLSSG